MRKEVQAKSYMRICWWAAFQVNVATQQSSRDLAGKFGVFDGKIAVARQNLIPAPDLVQIGLYMESRVQERLDLLSCFKLPANTTNFFERDDGKGAKELMAMSSQSELYYFDPLANQLFIVNLKRLKQEKNELQVMHYFSMLIFTFN